MVSIPYFQFISISVGPFTLYVWGFFVALGMVLSFFIMRHLLRAQKHLQEKAEKLFFWVVVAGILGSRAGHVFFYDWAHFSANPIDILKIWQGGLSSYGGFIGAAVPLLVYWKKNPLAEMRALISACTLAFPWGWGVGRLGCFLIHDHPGAPCPSCLLPIRYPDGSLRPDLGLYDALLAFSIAGILWLGKQKNIIKDEALLPTLVILYTIPRFFLDFLRAYPPAGDARYFGLTPGHYASAFFCALAVYSLLKKRS